MYLAIALTLELFTTYLALVLVIGYVTPLMSDQAFPVRGHVAATVTAETLLGNVFLLMLIQLRRRREVATAILADQLLIFLLRFF